MLFQLSRFIPQVLELCGYLPRFYRFNGIKPKVSFLLLLLVLIFEKKSC